MEHPKRVLVTGATGFIGHRLVQALLAEGMAVRVLARANSDLSQLPTDRIEICVGSLPNDDVASSAVDGVDGVIHLASLLRVPWRDEFHTVNVGGTTCIGRACAQQDSPPALIHVSSLAAIGPSVSDRGKSEGDAPKPVSIYGGVKLAAEQTLCSFAERVPTTIVRPPMVLGAGDTASLPLFKTIERGVHIMPTRRSFSVSAIHVDDLVDALLKVLWSGERLGGKPEAGYGIYHVAADEVCTYESLGLQIGTLLDREPLRLRLPAPISYAAAFASEWYARLSNRKLLFTRDKWREATAGHWVCRSDKLRHQFRWRPKYSLVERLEQTIQGYRQRRALRSDEA
ncbi:MAG: NAD-dependent epimerase/dehydratase family protein [Bradymonadia bacterium]